MAHIVYGVWNGAVHDYRTKSPGAEETVVALRELDVFNDDNKIRAFVGDRGFFVLDTGVSLIDTFWRYMDKAAEQSCGKCTPCRMGTILVRDALDALRHGKKSSLGFSDIIALSRQMSDTSLCGLGQTCARSLLAALENFRDEFEAEAREGAQPDQNGMVYVTAPCIEACPSKINVPQYIDYIRDGKPEHSLGVILQKYPMAATCGRVCVRFCEMACRRNLVDEAVGIKTLKRYVADYQTRTHALSFSQDLITDPLPPSMRIAVVGAGPAGVSCAYHLLLEGYHVDILEAMDQAGGMAAIGIPSYRLPKDVLKSETDIITQLGGHFLFNQALGRDYSIDDLFARGYRAVFLALGCQEGTKLGVADEDPTTPGYESGIGFLLKVHDHVAGIHKTQLSDTVVVVGGGNVAMDCVRSAVRMGARTVHLVYRSTRDDMPADKEEITAADCILHLRDASSPLSKPHNATVLATLAELDAGKIPIMEAFNKTDLLDSRQRAALRRENPNAIFISARDGKGLDTLLMKIEEVLSTIWKPREIIVSAADGALLNMIHENCMVISHKADAKGGVKLKIMATDGNWDRLRSLQKTSPHSL